MEEFPIDVDIKVNSDSVTLSDLIAKEKFIQVETNVKKYLDSKLGFKFPYSYEDSMGNYISYDFTIEESEITLRKYDPVEKLCIYNRTSDWKIISHIYIYKFHYSELPDRIKICDTSNNTDVSITRTKKGLLYENINEEGAKQLYDTYSKEFFLFKERFGINERIASYKPKMEIRQIQPPNLE